MVLLVLRSKKSTCVKEVEKIKQRRTERRAAQLAIREQHIQEYDISIPSWEFEAMIRYTSLVVAYLLILRLHLCD